MYRLARYLPVLVCLAAICALPASAQGPGRQVMVVFAMPQGVDPLPIIFDYDGDFDEFTGADLLGGVELFAGASAGPFPVVRLDVLQPVNPLDEMTIYTTHEISTFPLVTGDWTPVPMQSVLLPFMLTRGDGSPAIGEPVYNALLDEVAPAFGRLWAREMPDDWLTMRFRVTGYVGRNEVPEPGSLAFLAALLGGVAVPLRRRLRRNR